MPISQRQDEILGYLVRNYIQTAIPVSSGLLEEICNLNVSAATIRNDLQELARKRYVTQLHTSGGRVPTDKAYRYFVNNLIQNDNFEPTPDTKRKIKTAINSTEDPRRLNKSIAKVLSDLSNTVVITKVLNSPDFYKVGLAGLFEFPEFREMEKIFEITNLFERFESVFSRIEKHVFNQLNEEFGVLIGNENPLDYIKDETMIFAKYSLSDNLMGSLTMVGPTRMDYEKNISLVKYITEELNKLY